MTKGQFAIWLEGYFELSSEKHLTKQQLIILLNHANLVKVVNKNRDNEIEEIISFIKHALDTTKTDFFPRALLCSLFKSLGQNDSSELEKLSRLLV
ncbi:MAG: hypothetical protein Q8M03_09055 [Legionella sp.]|nr:hypothetical protein [Legionella sp.]